MIGLGTIINVAGIVVGGIFGMLFGKLMKKRVQDSLQKTCGVAVIFLGIAGAMEGMLTIAGDKVMSGGSFLIIFSLVPGILIGELINLEDRLEKMGEWLKKKTGNGNENLFVEGFVTASLTVCIGAMAIVGAIEDGISGDYSILITKSILDMIIIMVMTCSLGKGCIFSALPVALLQGTVTVLAVFIKPVLTDDALNSLSLVGSILIFCVGINLLLGKKIRVANLLPSIIFAVIYTYTPWY